MIVQRYIITIMMLPVYVHAAVPGSTYSYALENKLSIALANQAKDYKPRTRHLCENGTPCFTNRLILEDSPYLLQHAHNPVNWYTWSKEALETAQRQNKPIFLSIGYSTCHWCHVMEKESFDDLEVARVLNKHFIAIKVDREHRPDIDELYGYVPAITGKGSGWPTTLLLTPNGDAFFGGVYYPKQQLLELLTGTINAWHNRRDDIDRSAQVIMGSLRSLNTTKMTKARVSPDLIKRTINEIISKYDDLNGGFGETIKFPQESWLFLLLESVTSKQGIKIKEVLTGTLDAISNGAIHDHIGGGFHRYTVDPQWSEPHYEKMLYNQALLARIYLQAYAAYNNPEYLHVTLKTLNFVLDNMKSDSGLFWSAIDADSPVVSEDSIETGEGAYYTWKTSELRDALTQSQYSLLSAVYSIDAEHDEILSQTLNRRDTLKKIAQSRNLGLQQLTQELESIHKRLLYTRALRPAPMIDKKNILGWNSIFISALAATSQQTGSIRYRKAAIHAADYIWSHMKTKNGFNRIFFDNKASGTAQLEDYAYYLQALNYLHDIDSDKRWLQRSVIVASIMHEKFWDNERGGFYHTPNHLTDGVSLPIRPKSAIDRSIASANAVAATALLRLWQQTGNEQYRSWALSTISTFSSDAKQNPTSHASLLLAALNASAQPNFDLSYAARGNIRIKAHYKNISKVRHKLTVNFQIKEGWHINSSTPLEDYLIPTKLELVLPKKPGNWKLLNLNYPQGIIIKMGFSKTQLSLYKGNVSINAALKSRAWPEMSPLISLTLQACDHNSCLPPENIKLLATPAI